MRFYLVVITLIVLFFNAIYKDKIDLLLNVLDRLVISRKQIDERTTFPNRNASTNPRPY